MTSEPGPQDTGRVSRAPFLECFPQFASQQGVRKPGLHREENLSPKKKKTKGEKTLIALYPSINPVHNRLIDAGSRACSVDHVGLELTKNHLPPPLECWDDICFHHT